jgi:hypothetical protein
MKQPFAVAMRASMLVQLIAVGMCPLPAAAAMESARGLVDTGVTTAAQVEAAGGGSTAPAPATHRSGGSALTIGLGATLLPIGLGLILDPPQADGQGGEAGVALGATIGLLVGPAVGLASGGRGDLAKRGVIIRSVCCGLVVLGGAAAISMLNEDQATVGATGILALGIVGGGVGVASSIYDLVITPKAVEEGRRVSFRPLVTPSGMVGVRATF